MEVEICIASYTYGAVSSNCKKPVTDRRRCWTMCIALQCQAYNLYFKAEKQGFYFKVGVWGLISMKTNLCIAVRFWGVV